MKRKPLNQKSSSPKLAPLDEAIIQLNISWAGAARLKKHIHNLFELRDIDVEDVAKNTGLSQKTVSVLQDKAKELLSSREIFLAETDSANFNKMLHELKTPEDVIDALERTGVDSFASAQLQGIDFNKLKNMTPDMANKLSGYSRLSTFSLDMDLNKKLVDAGITGVVKLAKTDEQDLAKIMGVKPAIARSLRERAKVYRASMSATFTDAAIALSPANRKNRLYGAKEIPQDFAKVALAASPDTSCYVCEPCKSAFSPAAYLVDLIDFMKDSFPQTFPDLASLDKRFYRSFKDLSLSCEAVDKKVRKIEIANEVLEKYILEYRRGLTRDQLYTEFAARFSYPKPNVVTITFESYLTEMGTSRDEIKKAFEAAASSSPDRSLLDNLLIRLGVTEEELRRIDRRDQTQITISEVDALPTLIRKVKTKGIDQNDLKQLAAYNDAIVQAEVAIDRVKEYTLADIRANLIHAARYRIYTDYTAHVRFINLSRDRGPTIYFDGRKLNSNFQFLNVLDLANTAVGISKVKIDWGEKPILEKYIEFGPGTWKTLAIKGTYGMRELLIIDEDIGKLPGSFVRIHGKIILPNAKIIDFPAFETVAGANMPSDFDDLLDKLIGYGIKIKYNVLDTPLKPNNSYFVVLVFEYKNRELLCNQVLLLDTPVEDAVTYPRIKTIKELGNYLHIDLSVDACAMTTRVASAIDTLQDFILAFQLGREDVPFVLENRTEFDARWRWLKSYSLWHAAQMVFCYPENFLLPSVRRNQTPQFKKFVESMISDDISSSTIRSALADYEGSLSKLGEVYVTFTAVLDDRLFLFAWGGNGALLVTEQMVDGDWLGWETLDLPSERMVGAAGFNGHIYVFFLPNGQTINELEYTRIEPDSLKHTGLHKTGKLTYAPTQIKYPISFVAGPEYLSIYFGQDENKDNLASAVMDRFQRFKFTWSRIARDPRFRWDRKAVGHLGGNDYLLLFEKGQNKQTSWLVQVSNPYADKPTVTLTELKSHSEVDGNFYYVGTVHDGQLVIGYFYISNNQSYLDKQIAKFLPGTVPSWISFDIQYPPIEIRSVGNAILLYNESGYQILTFIGNTLIKGASWEINFHSTGYWLISHPILGDKTDLNIYRQQQAELYNHEQGNFVELILDEWFFFIPLEAARALNSVKHYQEAADWFHVLFYPYHANPAERRIYDGFNRPGDIGTAFRNSIAWLRDPFNPFGIARVRKQAFFCHVIYKYIENLLDWADAEFIRDTSESISHARELYELAEDILEIDDIPQDVCNVAWQDLIAEIYATHKSDEARILRLLLEPLQMLYGKVKLIDIDQIRRILRTDESFDWRLIRVKHYADQIKARPIPARTLDEIVHQQKECEVRELKWEDAYNKSGNYYPNDPSSAFLSNKIAAQWVPLKIGCGFCVPVNPTLNILSWRIESNLEKIRTCRNFAGMKRGLQTYATPSNPREVIEAVAAGESLEDVIPKEPPPIYRFSYLIERARYYVQVAKQMEDLLLTSLKEEDAEKYSLMMAKNNLKSAQATIALQQLRVIEASDGVELARRQKERAQFQQEHFQGLLTTPLSHYEQEAIGKLWAAYDWTIAASIVNTAMGSAQGASTGLSMGGVWGAIAGGILGAGISATQGVASVETLASQARSMQASFERRTQEWQLQSGLAAKDVNIGEQGITIANDRFVITEKERDISQLESDLASEVINFLGAKFTNKDLYAWMSRVVKQYYREHLNYSTVVARMAQRALAFERQETITIVASYYTENEKKDLLVAERLLSDINKLDQHRLITEKRHKELTKVVSLASAAPVEFQRFRESGRIVFETSMSIFDRDFPGHYMRLIKNVSLTIIALTPPGESIHATLSNAGISRVMVGPPFNVSQEIQRQPESISVSALSNGTGLFDLRLDDPILLPFEASGVETTWMLEMPKAANRFNYDTLLDVLLTIRYTALDDPGYRDKVIKELGNTVSSNTSFSLRNGFPDMWYHLNNPIFLADYNRYGYDVGKVIPPYEMQFELRQADYPPNETLDKIIRLNLVLGQDKPMKVPIELEFKPDESTDEYLVETDYDWDPEKKEANKGPISLTAFTHKWNKDNAAWAPTPTAIGTLKPFGRWRLRIHSHMMKIDGTTPFNKDDYPGLYTNDRPDGQYYKLNLDDLKDGLFVVTYEAKVEY